MAGDWIKMEAATPDKPEVLAITAKMGWDDPDLAVGKLFRVWRWFDQHTTDGNAVGVTKTLLDRIAGVTGFAEAMESVGWLAEHDDGITLPNFEKHCGKTAKKRAQTANRVAGHRANASDTGGNANSNAGSVTPALAREEKRREEKKNPPNPPSSGRPDDPPPGFVRFWAAWPRSSRKVAKAECLKRWCKRGLESQADGIVGHVIAMKATKQWRDGYEPAPLTYLNQSRWLDGEAEQAPSDAPWYVRAGFGDEHSAVAAGAKPEAVA